MLKTPEKHQWDRSGAFIVNFEHVNVSWDVAEELGIEDTAKKLAGAFFNQITNKKGCA